MTEGILLAEGPDACADVSVIDGVSANVSCSVNEAASGMLEDMYQMVVTGASWAVGWTAEVWLTFPEPGVGTAEGVPSDAISQLWSLQSFYTATFALICFMLGVARLVMSPSMSNGWALGRGVAFLAAVQSLGVALIVLSLEAGNLYSTWIVQQASGKEFTTALSDFAGLGGVSNELAAAGAMSRLGDIVLFSVLGFILLLLAALAQIALLIVRSALLIILLAFLPILAATTFTGGGMKAFGRAAGWIFALVLYKPVAGTIYAVGVVTLKNLPEEPDVGDMMLNLMVGLVIVAAAALALPALVKFVAPQAGIGASMAFSGGAMAAGAIGTGAAVASMGASAGGTAAAAAATKGAAPSAASGAATGAASSTTAAASAPTGSPSAPSTGAGGTSPTGSSGGEGKSGAVSGAAETDSAGSTSQSQGTTEGSDAPTPNGGGSTSAGGSSGASNSSFSGTAGGGEMGAGWESRPSGLMIPPGSASGAPEGTTSNQSTPQESTSGSGTGAGSGAPVAPVPTGSGASRSGAPVASAVRHGATGAAQGAQQVDFNRGQDQGDER